MLNSNSNFGSTLTFFFVLIVSPAFSSGCSRSPYTVAPVHGKVTVDDKLLSHATVMFAPISSSDEKPPGKPAFGTIEPDGVYHLTTFTKNDGAVVGNHWVTIRNVKDLPAGVPEFDRVAYPKKVNIVAGRDNEVDIKLTTAIIKKYTGDNR